MSFGLLLVYVAILAVNSGGNGILLPNIVAGLDEAGKIGNLAIVTTVAFVANIFAQPSGRRPVRRHPVTVRAPDAVDGGWRALTSGFVLASRWPSRCGRGPGLAGRAGRRQRPAGRGDGTRSGRLPAARRGGVSAMIGVGITSATPSASSPAAPPPGDAPLRLPLGLVVVIVGTSSWTTGTRQRRPAPRAHRRQGVPPRLLDQPAPPPRLRLGVRVALPMVIGFYGAQTFGLYILRDYIGLSDAESSCSPRRWASSCSSASCSPPS